jgi:DNA-binding NarL/FixJ family response regulator
VVARVLIVDDHPLFRSALVLALQAEPDFEIIAAVATAREAIETAKRASIDLAIVDLLMPMTSGITLCDELFDVQPSCKVLMMSSLDDPQLIAQLLRGHAQGYAIKSQPQAELVDAIRRVLGGERYVPPSVPLSMRDDARLASREQQMTRREREIFELVIRGNSNQEIATLLTISRRTVETHRQRVMAKLSRHSVVKLQDAARFSLKR